MTIGMEKIKGLILDMDGVLWRQTEPIGDLPKIFSNIKMKGLKIILATNNASLSVEDYLEKLYHFGVHLNPENIITSYHAAISYLKSKYHQGSSIFIVGEKGLIQILEKNGFPFSDSDVVAVVVGMDRQLTYEKMCKATLLIRAGAEFIATNADRTFPIPDGLVPGVGAILAALETAGKRGADFQGALRMGLKSISTMVPDMEVPTAMWDAYWQVMKTQYGYSKWHKNPLERSPLAKLSTVFWSYPEKTFQMVSNGLRDSYLTGDAAKFTRYLLYMGFQLSIAEAMLKLGLDVGSIFGVGILPVKMTIGGPIWDLLKNSYTATFGEKPEDREKGFKDFGNAIGNLIVPQFRYGKKVLDSMTSIQDGFRTRGNRNEKVMETNLITEVLSLAGAPPAEPIELWDALHELQSETDEREFKKRRFIDDGVVALQKGKWDKVREVIDKAKKSGVVIKIGDINSAYKAVKEMDYWEKRIKNAPKDKRREWETKLKELHSRAFPSTHALSTGSEEPQKGTKQMWSNETPQSNKLFEVVTDEDDLMSLLRGGEQL